MSEESPDIREAYKRHERRWRDNRYVYPVVSRRSGGISVGINLNPDKACNFDCIYCQVDRRIPPAVRRVDLDILEKEIDRVLEAERDGSLYEHPPCSALPPGRRGATRPWTRTTGLSPARSRVSGKRGYRTSRRSAGAWRTQNANTACN